MINGLSIPVTAPIFHTNECFKLCSTSIIEQMCLARDKRAGPAHRPGAGSEVSHAGPRCVPAEKIGFERHAERFGESRAIFLILGSDSTTMVSCLHILAQTLDTR